jgi:hypothetical protein
MEFTVFQNTVLNIFMGLVFLGCLVGVSIWSWNKAATKAG